MENSDYKTYRSEKDKKIVTIPVICDVCGRIIYVRNELGWTKLTDLEKKVVLNNHQCKNEGKRDFEQEIR